MVDGAQGAVHFPADVQALDIDFYAFSGHKLYGPTGSAPCTAKASCWQRCRPGSAAGK
ncbi:cysteine desulfurase CsdA-CsdE [Klebsiella pneumoniae]|uniref:Cysteine desulfurase CsdA-CsdE n=1 Tax=Klebsiella pneumoniae TaxID=573 RepID=A0A2X3CQ32_KLEPN|nr:cysteine desulfurase CsdA-CsdE [Klebsiella pneumoniae]